MRRYKQLRKKDFRQPENSFLCSRQSRYGNPFVIGDRIGDVVIDRELSLVLYSAYANMQLSVRPGWLESLRGYDVLGCYCDLDEHCHVDVLIRMLRDSTPPSAGGSST